MDNKIDLENPGNLDNLEAITHGDDNPMDNTPIKNDRKPISEIKATAVSKAKAREKNYNLSKETLDSLLPKSYTEAPEDETNVTNTSDSIYDKTISDQQGDFKAVKSATKKALPASQTFQPSKIAQRVKTFSAVEEKPSTPSTETVGNIEDGIGLDEVTSTLQTIFGAQRIDNDLRDQNEDINRTIDRKINKQQFEHSAAAQEAIAEGVSRLVGYQDNILDKYYRKSLELQLLQFAHAKQTLIHSKASGLDMITHLKSIIKNTALPEGSKERLAESVTHIGKASIAKKLHNAIADQAKAYIAKTLDASIKIDTDKAGKQFNTFKNRLNDQAVSYTKTKLARPIEFVSNTYSKVAEKYPDIFPTFRTAPESGLGHDFENQETAPVDTTTTTQGTSAWDSESRHTLVDIIPKYMSQSLDQLTEINALIKNAVSNNHIDDIVNNTARNKGRRRQANLSNEPVVSDLAITNPAINKLLENINTTLARIPSDEVRDKVDALIQASTAHFLVNESLLERIAVAVENMKTGNNGASEKKPDATRNTASKLWVGAKGLFNGEMRLRDKLNPIKRKVYGVSMNVAKAAIPTAINTPLKAAKAVLRAAGFIGKQAFKAGATFNKAKNAAKWIGHKAAGYAAKMPGRFISGVKRLKSPFKLVGDLGAGIVNGAGNILNRLSGRDSDGSPLGLVSGLFANLQNMLGGLGKKEDSVVTVLNNIYSYLQKAFPLQDSEEKEANRPGGVKDILRRRAEARKAKEEATGTDGKPSGKKGGSVVGGIVSNLMDKKKEEAKSEDNESIFSKVATWGSGALVAGKALLGGGAAAEAATAAAAGTETAIGGAGLAAGAATLGEVLLGAATLSNPLGWALLAGAGAYAGYKLYKKAKRNTKLKPLEMLRYLQYGVPVDNADAVATMRYFEETMAGEIDIPKNGMPKVDLEPQEIFDKFSSDFGCLPGDKNDAAKFLKWFYNRFLPVYVKHAVLARTYAKDELFNVDEKLPSDQKIKFVTSAQFGSAEAELGMSPLSIMVSPWKDIALADNGSAITNLTDQIINLCKRGEDVSAKNLKAITPVPAAVAPKKPDTDKDKEKPKPDLSEADEIAERDKKSMLERTVDWTKKNLWAPVKRVMGDLYEGGKEALSGAWNAVKSGAHKAGSWVSKNVVEPVSNSLAGLIKGAESGKEGYNAYNRGTMGSKILGPVGHRDLTSMTLQEILDDSKRPASDPQRLFAVGKYQMIPTTLQGAIDALGIDPTTTKYDENTQERLFSDYLLGIKRKKIAEFIKGKSNDGVGAVSQAASEWASIADPSTGASKYGNGNHASVSADSMLSMLTKSRNLYQQYVSSGMKEDEAYQKAVASDGSDAPAKTLAAADQAKGTVGEPVTPTSAPAPTVNVPTPGGESVTPKPPSVMVPGEKSTVQAKPVPSPFAMAQVEQTTKDTLANVEKEKALSASNDIPVMPDLTHISKTTMKVGETAGQQRDQQLSEAKKTNELLSNLLSTLAKANNATSATPDAQAANTKVSLPQPPKTVKPVVNLTRNF